MKQVELIAGKRFVGQRTACGTAQHAAQTGRGPREFACKVERDIGLGQFWALLGESLRSTGIGYSVAELFTPRGDPLRT